MGNKIILLGAKGMVGNNILNNLKNSYDILALSHQELDIRKYDRVEELIREFKPDYVINAAAYTKVDDAENNKDYCYEVNAYSVRNLAKICNTCTITLIHFSTDYVYDGNKKSPYEEDDIAHAINVYGESKFLGDKYIQESGCNYLILRTSWVYGPHGNNFIKKIIQACIDNNDLKIISDQFGVPTSSVFISKVLEKILNNFSVNNKHHIIKEIYNVCPSGCTSWYELAKKVVEYLTIERPSCKTTIDPITSSDYVSLANRPNYTVLSNDKLCSHFDINIKNWDHYLMEFLKDYNKSK